MPDVPPSLGGSDRSIASMTGDHDRREFLLLAFGAVFSVAVAVTIALLV